MKTEICPSLPDIQWQVSQATKVWSRDHLEQKMSYYKLTALLSEASCNFDDDESYCYDKAPL